MVTLLNAPMSIPQAKWSCFALPHVSLNQPDTLSPRPVHCSIKLILHVIAYNHIKWRHILVQFFTIKIQMFWVVIKNRYGNIRHHWPLFSESYQDPNADVKPYTQSVSWKLWNKDMSKAFNWYLLSNIQHILTSGHSSDRCYNSNSFQR